MSILSRFLTEVSMNAQLQTIPQPRTEPTQPQTDIPSWNLTLRIGFRFW